MDAMRVAVETEAENVLEAIVETIVTPAPGFGHGRVADLAAVATWLLTFAL